MLKILTLIFAGLVVVLCLLQEDKNDGILSIGSGRNNLALFKNRKARGPEKYFEIATWVCAVGLFTVILIQII